MDGFLKFLYGTRLPTEFDGNPMKLLKLLEVAEMYQVQDLKNFCINSINSFLNDKFTLESSLQVFAMGSSLEIQSLENKGIQLIKT